MKILIVDDSKAMRMILTRTLRQAGYGNHEIAEAANGAAALEMLKKQGFHLILCDWNMPEMSGIELLTAIRQAGLPTPFGFVTTEGSEKMRATASEAGANFLVSKPFTADSFRTKLREYLE